MPEASPRERLDACLVTERSVWLGALAANDQWSADRSMAVLNDLLEDLYDIMPILLRQHPV